MRTVQMADYGGAEVLRPAEMPLPEPGEGEVRVKVHAAAVNPADVKWRQGMFKAFVPLQMPHVLGYDVAGTVDALGAGVADVRASDRVVVMLDAVRKGGYAEYVVVPAEHLARIPDGIDFATAAALPTAGLTGVQLIEEHALVSSGETVLVTGALGAVGRFAMFAAKQAGAKVVAAVRDGRQDEARAAGADDAVALGGANPLPSDVDHVVDTIGGSAVAELCRSVAPRRSIVTASVVPIAAEGLSVEPRAIRVHNDAARLQTLAESVGRGDLKVPIARRLPLAEAAEAHRLIDQPGLGGKIVLEP